MDRIRAMFDIGVQRGCFLMSGAVSADDQWIVIPVDGVGPRFILQRRFSCAEALVYTRQVLGIQIGF